MKCAACGAEQFSHPKVDTGWRGIEVGDKFFYFCPSHFPGPGGTADEFHEAYRRVFKQIGIIPK